MKRIHGIGAEFVLLSETERYHDLTLTSVKDGASAEISKIGEFDIAQLPNLGSLLMLPAPEIPVDGDMGQYVKATRNPMGCELYQPPPQGFFAGLQRYGRRRLAEKAAIEKRNLAKP